MEQKLSRPLSPHELVIHLDGDLLNCDSENLCVEVRRGAQHHCWRGGVGTSYGYVLRYTPGHPMADGSGRVPEHILIVELARQRELPAGAEVHHVNQVRGDNRNENLVACNDKSYHSLLHQRMRARDATGDPGARICWYCKGWALSGDRLPLRSSASAHRMCVLIGPRPRRRMAKVAEGALHA